MGGSTRSIGPARDEQCFWAGFGIGGVLGVGRRARDESSIEDVVRTRR